MFYLLLLLTILFSVGGMYGYYKDKSEIVAYIAEELKDVERDKEVLEIEKQLGIERTEVAEEN